MQTKGALGLTIMLQRMLIMMQEGKNITDYVAFRKSILGINI